MEQSGQLARPITSRSHGSNPVPAIIFRGVKTKMEKIDASTLGVVVIDMQPSFLKSLSESEKENIISAHESFLKEISKKKSQIMFLEYIGCGKTEERIIGVAEKQYRENTFVKCYADGYYKNENFRRFIENQNFRNILYTGLYAGACVLSTAESSPKNSTPLFCKDLSNRNAHAIDWFSKDERIYDSYKTLLNLLE